MVVLTDLYRSFQPSQLELLRPAIDAAAAVLTTEQMSRIAELVLLAKTAAADEHDFDVMKRIVAYADREVLSVFIEMANRRLTAS